MVKNMYLTWNNVFNEEHKSSMEWIYYRIGPKLIVILQLRCVFRSLHILRKLNNKHMEIFCNVYHYMYLVLLVLFLNAMGYVGSVVSCIDTVMLYKIPVRHWLGVEIVITVLKMFFNS